MQARVWVGFAGYCVLAGSRWLLDEAVPSPLPAMLQVGVHSLLFGLICAAWWGVRGERIGWGILARVGLLAGIVFLLPDAVIEAGSGSLGGSTAALVFTLAPVVVVFAVAQQSVAFGAGDDPRRLLGPALAGVFGAALLIPFATPPSATGKVWLAALVGSVVMAGLAAVRLHDGLRGVPMAAAATVASGLVGLAGMVVGHGGWAAVAGLDARGMALEAAIGVGVDGPLLVLGLWVLRDMAPLAAVTRYPLVLVVTIMESYFLMHGTASWPMVVGAGMMVGSAAWLLRASLASGDSGSTSTG